MEAGIPLLRVQDAKHLLRFFASLQALRALLEVGHAMGAAEVPMAETAEHKRHFDPVFRFAVVTVFCASCLRHGPSPRIMCRFTGRVIAGLRRSQSASRPSVPIPGSAWERQSLN